MRKLGIEIKIILSVIFFTLLYSALSKKDDIIEEIDDETFDDEDARPLRGNYNNV